jgi:hypothetical protein
MIGLEFWVRFRRPIYADETIRMEWLVIKVTPNEKLNGEIVELRGRIKAQDGQTAMGARGRVLGTDRLYRRSNRRSRLTCRSTRTHTGGLSPTGARRLKITPNLSLNADAHRRAFAHRCSPVSLLR